MCLNTSLDSGRYTGIRIRRLVGPWNVSIKINQCHQKLHSELYSRVQPVLSSSHDKRGRLA